MLQPLADVRGRSVATLYGGRTSLATSGGSGRRCRHRRRVPLPARRPGATPRHRPGPGATVVLDDADRTTDMGSCQRCGGCSTGPPAVRVAPAPTAWSSLWNPEPNGRRTRHAARTRHWTSTSTTLTCAAYVTHRRDTSTGPHHSRRTRGALIAVAAPHEPTTAGDSGHAATGATEHNGSVAPGRRRVRLTDSRLRWFSSSLDERDASSRRTHCP